MEAKFLHDESSAVSERFELLKAMNTIIKLCNNECAYMHWIYIIPDQCDDDELFEIAMNDPESYQEACNLFRKIAKGEKFQEDGFYAGNQVF